MAGQTWDTVIARLDQKMSHTPKTRLWWGECLVALTRQLKDDPQFASLMPGLSLLTLHLSVPGIATQILVACQPDGGFSVCLATPLADHEEDYHDQRDVAPADIIPTLLEYIEKAKQSSFHAWE